MGDTILAFLLFACIWRNYDIPIIFQASKLLVFLIQNGAVPPPLCQFLSDMLLSLIQWYQPDPGKFHRASSPAPLSYNPFYGCWHNLVIFNSTLLSTQINPDSSVQYIQRLHSTDSSTSPCLHQLLLTTTLSHLTSPLSANQFLRHSCDEINLRHQITLPPSGSLLYSSLSSMQAVSAKLLFHQSIFIYSHHFIFIYLPLSPLV